MIRKIKLINPTKETKNPKNVKGGENMDKGEQKEEKLPDKKESGPSPEYRKRGLPPQVNLC
ncbi:MAG: hypothetical protein PHX30_00130 [Candidatus Pacebacteria bacterium]|nr:hypothetical protein [Candidatus Paceibacterota bacterium]